MIAKSLLSVLFLVLASLFSSAGFAAGKPPAAAVNTFIGQMVAKHRFDRNELTQLFAAVEMQDKILASIARPAEAMPWYRYRKIFMTDERIAAGVDFWRANEQALKTVERRYGVPAPVITAIIGVETFYGKRTGSYRVIDALSTLGFGYPKRSEFFLRELENFLLLCRDEHIDPLQPLGSYAGAMGMPQFMPSSFRSYAADFEGDKRQDIWNNPADAIASVANYFAKHQWHSGAPVAFPARVTGTAYRRALSKDPKPDWSVKRLQAVKVSIPAKLAGATPVKLLAFETENGEELWAGLHNFYVITRYNHSPLYALAVYQLSEAIAAKKKSAG
ncbi:MAG: lytic murein transglycosylase B [Gammaproteobacteria bacterium]